MITNFDAGIALGFFYRFLKLNAIFVVLDYS